MKAPILLFACSIAAITPVTTASGATPILFLSAAAIPRLARLSARIRVTESCDH